MQHKVTIGSIRGKRVASIASIAVSDHHAGTMTGPKPPELDHLYGVDNTRS